MEKIDFKKEFKHLYSASAKEPEIVDVPEMNFLMIDDVGDPNKSQALQEAIDVLYSVSYTLKFMVKKTKGKDYVVMSLEAPTIEKLHKFVEERGHKLRGKHHEIYLGDPRRTAPEKLKTVIRHPIE